MRGAINIGIAGLRQHREEARVRFRPAIAHRCRIDDLDLWRFTIIQYFGRRTGRRDVFVVRDVFPEVAKILGGERLAIRPFVALAQMEREDAAVLNVDRPQDIRLESQFRGPTDETRIAPSVEQTYVLLSAH